MELKTEGYEYDQIGQNAPPSRSGNGRAARPFAARKSGKTRAPVRHGI
ncbi:MAG: hypothetical protein ACRD98_00315 [Nitrososphaera sp.]